MGTAFRDNTVIEYFDELRYFTSIRYLAASSTGYFQGCTALKYIKMPEGLQRIDSGSFRNMGSTVRVDLPSSINWISNYSTYDIKNPTILIVRATTPPTFSGNPSGYFARWNPIYVPDDSVATYKAASVWSNYASKIKALSEYTGR